MPCPATHCLPTFTTPCGSTWRAGRRSGSSAVSAVRSAAAGSESSTGWSRAACWAGTSRPPSSRPGTPSWTRPAARRSWIRSGRRQRATGRCAPMSPWFWRSPGRAGCLSGSRPSAAPAVRRSGGSPGPPPKRRSRPASPRSLTNWSPPWRRPRQRSPRPDDLFQFQGVSGRLPGGQWSSSRPLEPLPRVIGHLAPAHRVHRAPYLLLGRMVKHGPAEGPMEPPQAQLFQLGPVQASRRVAAQEVPDEIPLVLLAPLGEPFHAGRRLLAGPARARGGPVDHDERAVTLDQHLAVPASEAGRRRVQPRQDALGPPAGRQRPAAVGEQCPVLRPPPFGWIAIPANTTGNRRGVETLQAADDLAEP